MNNPLKRTFSRTETWITLLYEIIILFLFLGAIVPHDKPLSQFFKNPLQHIQISEISIALALAIFLPALFKHLKTLKIFGAEIELLREVKEDIFQVKREASLRQFDHERALYTMAASLGRNLEVHSERSGRNLKEIPVQIGMMDFTESSILSQVVYRLLESHPIPAREPEKQESTLTTFFNLRSGAIDLYIGYSGTGMMLAGMPVSLHTAESGRERLNRIYEPWGVKWLPSLGFQNQEKLVMRKKQAEELNIHAMTDLAEHSDKLIFGANREYFLREWAYPRLERLGMEFENICEVDINDRLSGLLAGVFDVGVIWTTDPEMDDPRLKGVEPDERFPSISQYAMPVCRERVLPAVEPVLSRLQITEIQMRKLNRLARRAGSSPLAIKGLANDFVRGRR